MDNPQESHSRSDAFNDYRKAALAEPSRVDRKPKKIHGILSLIQTNLMAVETGGCGNPILLHCHIRYSLFLHESVS